jgi:hypothetical protein
VGVVSSILLVVFQAETHALIPLYAFGVFTAFTVSQLSMVIHWRRTKEPGWRKALGVNAIGAVTTGLVALIIGATKFLDGAWISMGMMLLLMALMWRIRLHYQTAEAQLQGEGSAATQFLVAASSNIDPIIIIPVDELNTATLRTAAYARSLSPNVTAVHVGLTKEEADELRSKWEQAVPDVPLVLVDSPYRSLLQPLLAYIDAIERRRPEQTVTVMLPEFVPHRPWHALLHNRLAGRLKRALRQRPHTVVVDVPFRLLR